MSPPTKNQALGALADAVARSDASAAERHEAGPKTHAERLAEEPMLKFFAFVHLPKPLQDVSRPLHDLAHELVDKLPRCAERTAGLRKLLEAKDCLVRAALP